MTSAMIPLPPRTTLVRLAFARALTPGANLTNLRTRILMTSPPDVAAPPGFPVKSPLRFLLVSPIRAQGMVTVSSRAAYCHATSPSCVARNEDKGG